MFKKNDVVTLDICAISSDGNGIAKPNGFTVFVPLTDVGDTVQAVIIKVTKQYAVGKLLSIVKASENRIENDCPVYTKCGGCCFRHISYEQELAYKHDYVENNIRRIGKLNIPVASVTPSPAVERYRNKAVYPVCRDANGRVKIGFFAQHSHRVIACEDCLLQPTLFSDIVELLRHFFEETDYSIYDENTHMGVLRHIFIRQGVVSGEILVCLVINADELPLREQLVQCLTTSFPQIKSISINRNTKPDNAVLSSDNRVIFGSPYISDVLCDVDLHISPLSFYQINHDTAQNIYRKAADIADLKPDDILIDLYCGIGTIGLSMAHRVKQLIGVEIVPQAVENARENARLNRIENATFICDDAKIAAAKLLKDGIKPSVVLLDPPRKGCDSSVIETVRLLDPERVVMISCDSATLARDLAQFAKAGYVADTVYPYDMFPRTRHVECAVRLTRQNSFSLRNAHAHEANQLLTLYKSVVGSEFCVWNENYPGMPEIECDLANRNVYVLTQNDNIVGAISVETKNDMDDFDCWSINDGTQCEIARVAVNEHFQGMGLSTHMVNRLSDIMKDAGCHSIHLAVSRVNIPAYKTYLKSGFMQVGEASLYGGDYLLMEKVLL